MLHHQNYREFCFKYFYRLINHDDTIPEEKLKEYVEKTDLAWKQRNTRRLISTLPTLPKSPIPSILEPETVKKKPSIKKKVKSFLSLRKNMSIPVQPPPLPFVHIGTRRQLPIAATKDIFIDEKTLFGLSYVQGTYRKSPQYKPNRTESSVIQKNIDDEQDEDKVKKEDLQDKSCDNGNEELVYEKEKISFHDRSEIIIRTMTSIDTHLLQL